MSYSFIAAALVILTMSALLLYALRGLVREARRHADIQVGRLLRSYDEAIDEKSKKLMALQLQEQAEPQDIQRGQTQQPQPIYMETEQATYAQEGLLDCYALIAHVFQKTAAEEAKEQIRILLQQKKNSEVDEYRQLVALFDGAVRYEMMTLGEEQQREVLYRVLAGSTGQGAILKQYLREHEHFNLETFVDYARNYIFTRDTTVYVRVGRLEAVAAADLTDISIIYDERIHEGCIITCRNSLYDYSL